MGCQMNKSDTERMLGMLDYCGYEETKEAKEADLLIHVVDASNPKFLDQIKATNNVLKELNVVDIPAIYAFNKIDKVFDFYNKEKSIIKRMKQY